MRSAALVVTSRMPVEALDPLEQEVGLEIGVAVVGAADIGAARHQRVALVEQQDDVELLGGGEGAVEVFSVSPMYLLTTAARSMR